MQIRTPTRQPGPQVGLDDVPSRYKAKQAGLDRTLLAAYTGTHRGHTRDMLFGSRGHYSHKSTVSARLASRPEACDQASEDGTAAARRTRRPTRGPDTYSGAAGTAASDLISMRQPVSLAASLAFCPSLPIASDSW